MRAGFWIVLLLLIPGYLFSGNVNIFGNAPEYKNETLVFYTFSDQITYNEKQLASCDVQLDGSFSCSFEVSQTSYVFLHLGIYEAFLFIEPGKTYEIILPEHKSKSIADELNPYFKSVQYHLGIENITDQELNYQLAYFDEVYSRMINNSLYQSYEQLKKRNANSKYNKVDTAFSDKAYSRAVNNNSQLIYQNLKELDADKEIQKIDSIFSNDTNQFFRDFRKYKLASFLHLSSQEKMKSISNTYFLDNPILYHNPAYMSLFNEVYKEYFIYFGRTEYGSQIYTDINKLNSYSALNSTLQKDSILMNDTLCELVILKCLYDEFYNDKFSRKAMLTILDSLEMETTHTEHKLIARNIKNKVTKLMVGYKPPQFNLFDKDSNLVSLNDFQDKYVYVGFCTTVSYACIKEFEMLRNLYEKHKDHFEIIMICMDENLPQMKHFVERKNYPFTFLYYGNQPDVFKDYDIRAFPTYYFIDKEGKLSLSPAASPGENVEFQIFKIMRANGDI